MMNLFISLLVCFYANLVNCQITFVPDQNSEVGWKNECHYSYQNKNNSVRNVISDVVIEPQIKDIAIFEDIQIVSAITSIRKKGQIKQVLNNLKDSINEHYGLYEGASCVNSGPCGNFANLFYQKWNKRFDQKVSISFIMSADSSECYHVLIKLPDNDYYDGGNGILTKKYIIKAYEDGMYIIDMLEYDLELLDEKSYGLVREFPRCPNYSAEETSQIIDIHLDRLSILLE
ncbi:MAG: hypothetical protein HRT58_06615 [Crocinitomicaceae bacterium]|nr:hypothetical protein [Flavobacteriales bacterium]NQZ35318.1 hypothetical protein [Crocinitomicaceae bacterium]